MFDFFGHVFNYNSLGIPNYLSVETIIMAINITKLIPIMTNAVVFFLRGIKAAILNPVNANNPNILMSTKLLLKGILKRKA